MAVKAVFVLKLVFVLRFRNLLSTELGRGTLENISLRIWMFIGGYIVWNFFLPHYAVLFLPQFYCREQSFLEMHGVRWYLGVAESMGHTPIMMWQFENWNPTDTPEILAMSQSRNHNELPVQSVCLYFCNNY